MPNEKKKTQKERDKEQSPQRIDEKKLPDYRFAPPPPPPPKKDSVGGEATK